MNDRGREVMRAERASPFSLLGRSAGLGSEFAFEPKNCVFICVCALICVLHVSVQVLQPSLWFKHSLGCHYGLITVSV